MLVIHNIQCTQISDKQQIWECVECGYKFRLDLTNTIPQKKTLIHQPDPINVRHYGSTIPNFLEANWIDVSQFLTEEQQ